MQSYLGKAGDTMLDGQIPVVAASHPSVSRPWRSWSWWVCLIALTSQVFVALGTTLAAAIFAAITLLNAMAYPGRTLSAMTRSLLPWMYPAVALASTLWSDAPVVSVRLALELGLTTGMMVALSRQLHFRDVLSALMLALLVGAVVSAAITEPGVLLHAGRPIRGIFDSKNALAFHMVVLVLAALGVALDRNQALVLRCLAVAALALGLLLSVAARSAGATIMGLAAVAVFGSVILVGALPRRLRARAVAAALGVMIVAGGLTTALGPELQKQVVEATGKDSTLTGRTYLWLRAGQLIAERPALGYGYQAFWRQDYVEAEGLWRFANIPSRAGFHFHNLFYEVAIELGMAGVLAMAATLLVFIWRSARIAIRAPGASNACLLGLCALLMMRTGIEVDLGYPFSLASALFPILLTQRLPRPPQPLDFTRPQ